jgi:hypothetical protein
MPSQDFIDVRVICDGSPLTEYLDPEGASDKGNSHKRFVEARTNQKFAVRVTLLPGFDFEYAPEVHGKVTLDDATAFSYDTAGKAYATHRKGKLLKAEFLNFTSIRYKNDATGNWERFSYKFGALGLSEECIPLCSLSTTDVNR